MFSRHIIRYEPRPLQAQFHEQARRFSVAVCHRRFGKTVMAVNHLLRNILNVSEDRPQGAYIAPTYGQAKRIAWSYCKAYAVDLPNVRFSETELRIDFSDDRRIMLLGSENPDRLRGLYFDYVVFDEYADIDPRLYPEIIRPALADRGGGALWIGTPRGHNHFWEVYRTALSAGSEGDPDWHACRYRASETAAISGDELAAARRDMSAEQYEQEFECSFTAAVTGTYYGRLLTEAETEGRIRKIAWEPLIPVHTAWDLGISDSTAIWFFQIGPEGRRYIDFYEASGEGLLHFAKTLAERPYVYGDHILPHDVMVRELGSGKSRFEMLRELGIRSRVAPRLSVQDGIESARVVLRNCAFDAGKCRAGLDSLRQYRREFDAVRRAFRDRPLHDWTSHAADAFRISAVSPVERADESLRRVAQTGRLDTGGPAVISEYAVLD